MRSEQITDVLCQCDNLTVNIFPQSEEVLSNYLREKEETGRLINTTDIRLTEALRQAEGKTPTFDF